jgi:hypothetical protein
MMVSYAEDPNYIHIELMKNRNASEYVRATALTTKTQSGIAVKVTQITHEVTEQMYMDLAGRFSHI